MFRFLSLWGIFSVLLATSIQGAIVKINGAGATFPYPLYSKWFSHYNEKNPGVQFNYQSIGSGGGIRQLLKQTVDFGASDAPMKKKDLDKAPWKVWHIPTVLGAVAISYNLPSLKKESIRLDGPTLANIFLGKITKWNHPAIVALNPSLKLPDQFILVIRRADGSGTTAVFSDYLAKVSPEWKQKVGHGKTLAWPTGIGAKGNDGVTAQVKNNEGAMGYVELAYAFKNGLQTVALKNKEGKFVPPGIEGISSSAKGINDVKDGISIVDAGGEQVYPISAFTYILLPITKQGDMVKSSHIKKFLIWALTHGQGFAEKLHYAPLPPLLAQRVVARLQGK